MRVVQALHWLKDTLVSDRDRILRRLAQVSADPTHGAAIRQDLIDGFGALPAWMQNLVRELPGCDPQIAAAKTLQPRCDTKQLATRRRSAKHLDVTWRISVLIFMYFSGHGESPMNRSRPGWHDRQTHTNSMKHCQKRLERRIAAR